MPDPVLPPRCPRSCFGLGRLVPRRWPGVAGLLAAITGTWPGTRRLGAVETLCAAAGASGLVYGASPSWPASEAHLVSLSGSRHGVQRAARTWSPSRCGSRSGTTP